MKKFICFLAFLLCIVWSEASFGEENQEKTSREEAGATWQEMILDQIDLDDVDQLLEQEETLSVSSIFYQLRNGTVSETVKQIIREGKQQFWKQLFGQERQLLQIFWILIASIIMNLFLKAFQQGMASEAAFLLCYLCIFLIGFRNFQSLLKLAQTAAATLTSFVKLLLPAYLLSVCLAAGTVTAIGSYEWNLAAAGVVELLICRFGFFMIQIYVILEMMNHITGEEEFGKLAELLKKVLEWGMKTIMVIFLGLQGVQCLIGPAMDQMKNAMAGGVARVIPGVGNLWNSTTQIYLGAALVVKNALGAAGIIAMILLLLAPGCKLLICAGAYKLLAAVTESSAEKRMVDYVSSLGEGVFLLLRLLLCTGLIFMISVGMIAAAVR